MVAALKSIIYTHSLKNSCKTKMGERLLTRWLRQPLVDRAKIDARLNLVEQLANDVQLRGALQVDRCILMGIYVCQGWCVCSHTKTKKKPLYIGRRPPRRAGSRHARPPPPAQARGYAHFECYIFVVIKYIFLLYVEKIRTWGLTHTHTQKQQGWWTSTRCTSSRSGSPTSPVRFQNTYIYIYVSVYTFNIRCMIYQNIFSWTHHTQKNTHHYT
jgi:hypothetical protein